MFHVFMFHVPMLAFSLHVLDQQIANWAHSLEWPVEPLIRLTLAAFLGGLVGLEREIRGRQAGFRTNLLVGLGCALIMIVSISFAYHPWPHDRQFNINVDPARIAYGVMAGIGFLGAGVIVKQDGGVRGLTTAAGLWCVAAIGLACGMGLYLIALIASVLVLAALWFLDYFEKFLPKVRYRLVTLRRPWHPGIVEETVQMIERHEHLNVRDAGFTRLGDDLSSVEIRLRIAFASKQQYYAFEQDLDRRPGCQIISASSES
jgi:putative Mg2+ transporter-C (MgtC) family protein